MGRISNGPIHEIDTDPQTHRSQISDHRLSTSCGVVERHDHHRDDDLVFIVFPVRGFEGYDRKLLTQVVGFLLHPGDYDL